MVLDFPTDIWKNYDIRHKIRQRYGSTLAYQQQSLILCTAFQSQEWESILNSKNESLTSFPLPLPSLWAPAPRRVPQIVDAPSNCSHLGTCTHCWIDVAPWLYSISLPSSLQNPSWFGSLKWNRMFSSCSYDIFSDYLYNSSISPGNASGPTDAGFLLPAEQYGWRLYLSSAVALSSALWWQCNQSLHSGALFLGTHLNAVLSGAFKIIKIRTRDDLASATFGYFIGLKYSLTVDFLIKPTISYCGRLVPQLSGHSTLLLEQREAVCSLKDSLVIFLPHCWQGSLCFVHCTVCAAILSLVTTSLHPSLAHGIWNFPHVLKCCSCLWNFPVHRQLLLLHLTSKFPMMSWSAILTWRVPVLISALQSGNLGKVSMPMSVAWQCRQPECPQPESQA